MFHAVRIRSTLVAALIMAAVGLCRHAASAEPAADSPLEVVRIANGSGGGHVHPAICVAPSGAILVAHFAEDDGKIFVLHSADGGHAWTDLGAVPDIGGGHPYPGDLTTLADGRIVLTWNPWVDPADYKQGRRPYFAVTADEGRTWSPPEKLPIDDTDEAYIRHAIWERSPTEWVFPMGLGMKSYNLTTKQLTPFGDPALFPGPLVETAAGALVHGLGRRSTDGGQTWTPIEPFPPVASYRCDLLALDNGWVVGAVAEDDMTFHLVTSFDDGRTWNLDRRWVIYEPGRYIGRACPQLAQLSNNHLGVVFWDANRDQPGGIGVYFARLSLTELRKRTGGEPTP
jgi:hypothetical protein